MPALTNNYSPSSAIEQATKLVKKQVEQSKDSGNLASQKMSIMILDNTAGHQSYASRAVPAVDIPDPSTVTLSFVYNFFTPDERVRRQISKEEQIINLKTSEEAQVLYELTNDQKPRLVRLNFHPPTFLINDTRLELAGESILNNLDKLVVEGASSSKYFSGTELLDTLADKSFYNFGKLTQFVQNTKIPEDSPNSNAHLLADEIASGGLEGNEKKLILDVMSDLQPEGYSYASSDTRREEVDAAYDSAARQSFSLKFNNLFFSDLVTAANRQSASVFDDELRAYTAAPSIADEIQQKGLKNVDPTKIFRDEYEFYGTPISSQLIPESLDAETIDQPPVFSITGYIVQRFEVLPNGSLEVLEPLILENPDSTYVVDSNIRYGATYIYKIRTIAIVEVTTKRIKALKYGSTTTQYVRSKFLLASEGVSGVIECVERVPPPPPANLSFRYDYNHRKPAISWSFPINPTRDIARFQVFKRNSIDEPFKLEVEYNFDSSVIPSPSLERGAGKRVVKMRYPVLSHIEKNYVDGSSPIYAIAAIDAHGMTSNYSEQFQIKYDKLKNKINQKLISKSGAPKPYPNIYLNEDTFQDLMKTSGKDRMTIVFDPEYYAVLQTRKEKTKNEKVARTIEDDLNLIAIDPSNPTYKIQIINTDLQQSELINIKIGDLTSPPLSIPAAKLSKNNLSFEFGIKVD